MTFVTAASNLRAANYMIPPSDMTSSRKLIGDIIPAIITTTAVVSGLACIEMVKALKAKAETHNSPLTCHREYCWDLGSPCGDVGWYNLPLTDTLESQVLAGNTLSEWDFIESDDVPLATLFETLAV